jgi:hypothetical protein
MTRCIALTAIASVWSLPAGAATVNLQFKAIVESVCPWSKPQEPS